MFDFFRKWLGATRNRVRQDPIGLPIFRRDPLKQRVLRLEIRACNQIPRLPDLVEGIDAVRLVRIAPSPEPDSKEMAGVAGHRSCEAGLALAQTKEPVGRLDCPARPIAAKSEWTGALPSIEARSDSSNAAAAAPPILVRYPGRIAMLASDNKAA
jgi:hypothetical protein